MGQRAALPTSASSRLPGRRAPLRAHYSDERLAKLVARDGEKAFAELYRRHHQALYRYCRSIVRSEDDAEDALQSAMAGAFAALQKGERDLAVRPWLYRIAHNESISLLRRRRPEEVSADEQALRTPASEGEPGETLERRERLANLIADVRALAERQRAALLMRELSGLSIEEIAAALSTSQGAAKQALFEARTALKEMSEGRSMECEKVRRLVLQDDGRVLRGRRVRSHLRTCDACREVEETIAGRSADLHSLAPALPAAAASAVLSRLLVHGGGHLGSAGGGAAGGGAAGGGAAGGTAGAASGSSAAGGAVAGGASSGAAGVGLHIGGAVALKAIAGAAIVAVTAAGAAHLALSKPAKSATPGAHVRSAPRGGGAPGGSGAGVAGEPETTSSQTGQGARRGARGAGPGSSHGERSAQQVRAGSSEGPERQIPGAQGRAVRSAGQGGSAAAGTAGGSGRPAGGPGRPASSTERSQTGRQHAKAGPGRRSPKSGSTHGSQSGGALHGAARSGSEHHTKPKPKPKRHAKAGPGRGHGRSGHSESHSQSQTASGTNGGPSGAPKGNGGEGPNGAGRSQAEPGGPPAAAGQSGAGGAEPTGSATRTTSVPSATHTAIAKPAG